MILKYNIVDFAPRGKFNFILKISVNISFKFSDFDSCSELYKRMSFVLDNIP